VTRGGIDSDKACTVTFNRIGSLSGVEDVFRSCRPGKGEQRRIVADMDIGTRVKNPAVAKLVVIKGCIGRRSTVSSEGTERIARGRSSRWAIWGFSLKGALLSFLDVLFELRACFKFGLHGG
jgi:hypothetical protein